MKFNLIIVFTIFFNSVILAQVPEDGLMLYLPFYTSAIDESGNNINGTVNGALLVEDRFENANHAYSFNGTNHFIELDESMEIQPDFPFTISIWFTVNEFAESSSLLYASDEITDIYSGFWVGYVPDGNISIGYGDGMGTGPTHRVTKKSLETIVEGEWYHVTGVYNAENDLDLYIDCIEDTGFYSGTGNGMSTNISNGVIGRSLGHHPESYHNGIIDDIRFYNRALSVGEIELLCKERNPSLSLPDYTEDNIKVYPNPTNNHIFIETTTTKESKLARVELVDLLGKVLIKQGLNDDITSLKLDFEKGFYIINIIGSNNEIAFSKKILIN